MYKNLRKERAAAGLCTNCGGTLDTDGRMCSACREKCRTKKTESVQWYRSNGICPLCKKVEIFSNENMCPECRAKRATYAGQSIIHTRMHVTGQKKMVYKDMSVQHMDFVTFAENPLTVRVKPAKHVQIRQRLFFLKTVPALM